jgi:hypothetical protein
MKDLPGVKVTTPYEPVKFKPHQHEWQRVDRQIPGGTMRLHVCVLHVADDGEMKPVWKAFDMEIVNPDATRGETEYEAKSKHN